MSLRPGARLHGVRTVTATNTADKPLDLDMIFESLRALKRARENYPYDTIAVDRAGEMRAMELLSKAGIPFGQESGNIMLSADGARRARELGILA